MEHKTITAKKLLDTMGARNFLPSGCSADCPVYINGSPVNGVAHISGNGKDELHLWDGWHGKAVE